MRAHAMPASLKLTTGWIRQLPLFDKHDPRSQSVAALYSLLLHTREKCVLATAPSCRLSAAVLLAAHAAANIKTVYRLRARSIARTGLRFVDRARAANDAE